MYPGKRMLVSSDLTWRSWINATGEQLPRPDKWLYAIDL